MTCGIECVYVIIEYGVCMDALLSFLFNQESAYEMRISDWSSDVCSSDLPTKRQHPHSGRRRGMKFNIESDCTPEEARRLFGLPDLEQIGRASCRERVCQYV